MPTTPPDGHVQTAHFPHSLKHFDELPDAAEVGSAVVCGLFHISPATLWRWTKSGRLPEPRRRGARATRWNVGELRDVLAGGGEPT